MHKILLARAFFCVIVEKMVAVRRLGFNRNYGKEVTMNKLVYMSFTGIVISGSLWRH